MFRTSWCSAAFGSVATCALLACATTSPTPRADRPDPVTAVASFCTEAQRAIAGTTLEARNIVHRDYDAFVTSKPAVRPLETQQYNWYLDAAQTQLRMISCKMKTTDHLRTEYGADRATLEGSCALLNERTLQAVTGAFSRSKRGGLRFDGGRRVVFDPDETTTQGPEWLKPYDIAYLDVSGALHVKSKGMRNDWLDPRIADRPPRFRGTRYCHLIAPDYLRRLLLGEVTAVKPR